MSAPSPLQNPDPVGLMLGIAPPGGCGEDCLALDIFVPEAETGPKAVLVWLPGGAFISGAASAALYDGSRLARHGDVVVVTVSYRVGAMGFSFVGDPEALVPNLGLHDQIEALRWVRANIEAFGGDPERVSVFGESAGAGSILALFGMPAARGLFRRAIVQSASPVGVLTPAEAAERSTGVFRALGLDAGDVEGFRALDAESILAAQAEQALAGPHRTGMFYAPVVDGVHLEAPPRLAATSGWARDVDLLIGTTRDEMRLYFTGQPSSEAGAQRALEAQMTLPPESRASASQELLEGYRRGRLERGEAAGACDIYLEIQTDLSLRVPACSIAERRFAAGNTRMYRFDWRSQGEGGVRGAFHTIDLPFVFGNLEVPGMSELTGGGPQAQALSRATLEAWSAFARTGDPSHPGVGEWPVYESGQRATLLLDEGIAVAEAPMEQERRLVERLGCFDGPI
jgi:para-nitrobenzyl esterase